MWSGLHRGSGAKQGAEPSSPPSRVQSLPLGHPPPTAVCAVSFSHQAVFAGIPQYPKEPVQGTEQPKENCKSKNIAVC